MIPMIDLSQLNKQQREAVETLDGPIIAIAGAGSGKTRCLTYRIAYMLDKNIKANNIVAITFTNKAAAEIKSRVIELIGDSAKGIWMGTFHSICLRILKVHANVLGYEAFTIYDDGDQDKILKGIIKALEKENPSLDIDKSAIKAYISKQKSNIIFPEQAFINAENDENLRIFAKIYATYQSQLKFNNAMDFDDLILNTYTLLTTDDDIKERYQEKFKYIMVDESQDTDSLQFKLIQILGGKHNNIFLVGDDWQSIYSFRNANLHNFLRFTSKYPEAKVVKIETNYRSTGNIVDAANAVVANNRNKLEKTCMSSKGLGRKIHFHYLEDEYQESFKIVQIIKDAIARGCSPQQIAVLYRTNFQSRSIEQELVKFRIPYNVISGLSFFDRKEIKDIVAYLKLIINPYDAAAFARIINVPKRGVGEASTEKITISAYNNSVSILEQLRDIDSIKGIPKKAKPEIEAFVNLIEDFREYMVTEDGIKKISHNIVDIFERSGYQSSLLLEDDGEDRVANVEELISMAAKSEEDHINMEDFITNIALMSDQDALSDNKVNLMTVHASKGLEYDVIVIAGANEGLFPHFRSFTESDVEEERRLFYVAMTRAKRELNITATRYRMSRGNIQQQDISRFVGEVPEENIDIVVGGKKKDEDYYID